MDTLALGIVMLVVGVAMFAFFIWFVIQYPVPAIIVVIIGVIAFFGFRYNQNLKDEAEAKKPTGIMANMERDVQAKVAATNVALVKITQLISATTMTANTEMLKDKSKETEFTFKKTLEGLFAKREAIQKDLILLNEHLNRVHITKIEVETLSKSADIMSTYTSQVDPSSLKQQDKQREDASAIAHQIDQKVSAIEQANVDVTKLLSTQQELDQLTK